MVAPEVRDAFALNTCDGCHQAETNTSFLHVNTRSAGTEATLSTWLEQTDMPRREQDMIDLLTELFITQTCAVQPLAPEDGDMAARVH